MTLRKAIVASPLAVLVAVLAHVAAFGFSHAPGAERSVALLGSPLVGLALGVLSAFAAGLWNVPRSAERLSPFGPLILAGFGIATFGLIEWSEGHAVLTALASAACAACPIAYAVAWLAAAVGSIARTAGTRYGAFIRRTSGAVARAFALATREPAGCGRAALVAQRAFRGRGPPLFI